MTIIDLLTSAWAIVPAQLREIENIYATHLRGDKIDVEALEARLGRPLANEQKAYSLVEGTSVAILEIAGVIAPKANMFTRISGGAAASMLQQQVQSMASDPRVTAVIIDADSPGGNVLGIPALADAIAALAAVKPTVTVCTGTMASAMYWVGAAANAVFLSGATDNVGSIGVVASHTYRPTASGEQTTEISAGTYKRIASDRAPLSAEGRAYMQSQVDQIYTVFVDTVAKFRGVSAEDVLAHMADGRVFIGQQAIDAGLADGFSTVDQMVERLAADPSAFAQRKPARIAAMSGQRPGKPKAAAAAPVPAPAAQTSRGTPTMPTPQEAAAAFKAENPEAAALLVAEGHAGGAAAELARVQAVRAQIMPGHEALIDSLAFDGKTTGPEAAVAVVAAERASHAAQASARAGDAAKPVPAAPAPAPAAAAAPASHAGMAVSADRAQLHGKALAYQAQHPGTEYIAAVKAVQAMPATE